MWGKATLVTALAVSLLLLPSPSRALQILRCPREIAQGEMKTVELLAKGTPRGEVAGEPLAFFRKGGRWKGILAVDLEAKAALRKVTLWDDEGSSTFGVRVKRRAFPIQRITLPPEMVELKGEALRRVRRERTMVHKVLSHIGPRPLWKANFVLPVRGRLSGAFGLRRIINGRFRTRHRGVDIAAPEGTSVVASNGGVVALSASLFLEGRTVIIDHGLGLFSLYLHLKEVFVREGQRVEVAEPIGTVGATGRTKGAHLHWGVVFRGKKVDPLSLMEAFGERGWRRGLSRRP